MLIVSLMLMTIVAVLPAPTSAQGEDLRVFISQPTIFIGESVTIQALYLPAEGENISAYKVDVYIYEMQTGSGIWEVHGGMSSGGNFTCVFETNRTTEFGYYTAYVRVQNMTASREFTVQPSNLDNYLIGQEIKAKQDEFIARAFEFMNWQLPITVIIALFAGGYVAFRTRVKEGKLRDIWDYIFTFLKERKVKKMFKDYRDPDRSKYKKHHDKSIALRTMEINDLEDNKRHALSLYNRKLSRARKLDAKADELEESGEIGRAHRKREAAKEIRDWCEIWKKNVIFRIERHLQIKQRIQKETKSKFLSDALKEHKRIIEEEPEEKAASEVPTEDKKEAPQ
jgi:hypothetical protein